MSDHKQAAVDPELVKLAHDIYMDVQQFDSEAATTDGYSLATIEHHIARKIDDHIARHGIDAEGLAEWLLTNETVRALIARYSEYCANHRGKYLDLDEARLEGACNKLTAAIRSFQEAKDAGE